MAFSLSVYGSCFDLESFARVNTSAAHIPQYLRKGQSQILLKNSANYIFNSHVFLWDFTDTFLIFSKMLKLTFNKLKRCKEWTLINIWGTGILKAIIQLTLILIGEIILPKLGCSHYTYSFPLSPNSTNPH